jgi:hypothetical protein
MKRAWAAGAGAGVGLLCIGTAVLAQSAIPPLFRCEGPPALYTVDARLASLRGCKVVSQASARVPVRTAQARAHRAEADTSPAIVTAPSRFVPMATQRERDVDRRRILQEELHSERERLVVLQQRMDTSGVQSVDTELPRQMERVTSNIAALQRELAATNLR